MPVTSSCLRWASDSARRISSCVRASEPAGGVSLDWGQAWIAARNSALALVPSIIVPEELNLLINPAHPDASKIKAWKMRKWLYDARLL